FNRRTLGKWGHDPVLQHARAHRRHGAIQDRQERSFALALTQCARQLKAAARDLVEEEKAALPVGAQAVEVRQAGLESFLQVKQQGAGRRHTWLLIIEAEAGQSPDAEMPQKRGPRAGWIERPVRPLA